MAIKRAAYDLVVIGAGSGGLEAAYNAATLYKARVAVIDVQTHHGPPFYSALGGTCVNVGCVPKKLMVTGAGFAEHFKDAVGFGWSIPQPSHSWATLMAAKDKAVLDINKSYESMFTEGLEFVMGWGAMKDKTTVLVTSVRGDAATTTHELSAKFVLLATGGWPVMPKLPGIEHCISSNEAFYLREAPKRVLIVGGGFIAVEFAGIFQSFLPHGLEGAAHVTLCYRGPLFLRGFDRCVREELRDQMTARGIRLKFLCNPTAIEKCPDGTLKVTFDSCPEPLLCDVVMFATGRSPNVSSLNLSAIGVAMAADGSISVDPNSKTSVDNVYAIGDVTNRMQLTPVAIHAGAGVAETLFGGQVRAPNHHLVPYAVFSIPQIGTVGLAEDAAAKVCARVAVYRSRFTPLMHKVSGQAHKGFLCKVVVNHDTGLVLGVHICGADAAETIQGVGIAVKMGAKIQDFYGTIGVHPTSAEELCSMRTPSYFLLDGVKAETLPGAAAASSSL